MSAVDKKKRFDSLMPSRNELPPHKAEVIDSLMGTNSEETGSGAEYNTASELNTRQLNSEGTLELKTEEVSNTSATHTNTENVHGVGTPKTETKREHNNSNIEPEVTARNANPESKSSFDIATVIETYEQEKKAKKSYDELYTKHTFVIRKDLITRLEKIAKKHSRGFKTRLINELLEQGLSQLEQKKS